MERRWLGGSSGLGNYGDFYLDIRSGSREVKKIVLLDGDDSSLYSFAKPSGDEVSIKLIYWADPKVVKINFFVQP